MAPGTYCTVINECILKESMCCFCDITVSLVKNTISNYPRSLGGSLVPFRTSSFMALLVVGAEHQRGGVECWKFGASGIANAQPMSSSRGSTCYKLASGTETVSTPYALLGVVRAPCARFYS